MRYKKYTIEPVYAVGSDFRVLKDGSLVDRKPTNKDIEYYLVLDSAGWELGREFTVELSKVLINRPHRRPQERT